MLTVMAMTEQEQVTCFKIEDELIANRTMDETSAKQYAPLCIERARQCAAKVQAMTIPLYLQAWAKEMAGIYGNNMVIKVHHNYLPWIEAFLVTRYGEAVEHWPEQLSEKDLQRAREWKTKRLPSVVAV